MRAGEKEEEQEEEGWNQPWEGERGNEKDLKDIDTVDRG